MKRWTNFTKNIWTFLHGYENYLDKEKPTVLQNQNIDAILKAERYTKMKLKV